MEPFEASDGSPKGRNVLVSFFKGKAERFLLAYKEVEPKTL